MCIDARRAEEIIWLGVAEYAADPRSRVGNRWFATGIRYAGLNGVFPTVRLIPPGADLAAAVHEAMAPFRAAGLPMLWHLGPAAPAGLVPHLEAGGCRFYEEEPLMISAARDDRDPVPPRGLEIVEATGTERMREAMRVWSGSSEPDTLDRLAALRSSSPAFTTLLGLLDGVPVATAGAFHAPPGDGCADGRGEVQHVVTAQGARRRGIGTALTVAARRALRERGASVVVLTASPDGEGIYRDLGFRTVGSVRRYAWYPPC